MLKKTQEIRDDIHNEFEEERVTMMMGVERELKNVVNGMNVKNSDTNEEENFVKC